MLAMSNSQNARVGFLGLVCVVVGHYDLCSAQNGGNESTLLPLSPAYVAVPGETTFKPSYSTVEWEGREFAEKEGTNILMRVITNPAIADAPMRAKALQRLARFRNKEINPRLIDSYNHFSSIQEKIGTIQCLSASEDPRGLPLFAKILEDDNTKVVRLAAAAALAQWNIRRGVAELVTLLESNELLDQPARWPLVRDYAINHFISISHHKGWGFPEEEIRKSIIERTDLDDNAKSALFVSEIKKWWTDNENRFPDWKLGDPVPAVEPNEPHKERAP